MYFEEQLAVPEQKEKKEKQRSSRLSYLYTGLIGIACTLAPISSGITPFLASAGGYFVLYRRRNVTSLLLALPFAYLLGGFPKLCGEAIYLSMVYAVFVCSRKPHAPLIAAAFSSLIGVLANLITALLTNQNALFALSGTLGALAAFVFAYALFPALDALGSLSQKRSWSSREQLALAISAGILTPCCRDVNLFGISLMMILTFAAAMLFLHYLGLDAALCYSVIVSGLICLNTEAELVLIPCFLLAVTAAGLKLRSGKLAEAVIFLIVSSNLFFIFSPGQASLLLILDSALACAIFLFTAQFILDPLRGRVSVSSDKMFVFMNEAVDLMLKEEIDSQRSMLSALGRNISEEDADEDVPKKMLLRELSGVVCTECEGYEQCWVKCGEDTYNALSEVLNGISRGTEAENAGLSERCKNLYYIKKVLASLYEKQRTIRAQKVKMNRFKRLMNIRIEHLSGVLLRLYSTLSAGMAIYRVDSADALASLQNEFVALTDLIITEDFSQRLRIFAKSDEELSEEALRGIGADILSEITGKPIIYDGSRPDMRSEQYRHFFSQEYDYRLSVGISKAEKLGTSRCGDNTSSVILSCGVQMVAICDGMGSGEAAAAQSARVLNMLEELLNCGSEQSRSIQTVNSILALEDDRETFSTLDLLLFDLREGTAEFIKAGAAASFIRSGERIAKISLDTLPIGILEDTHTASIKAEVQRGDYIYMMSDGFMDAFPDEALLREVLEEHDYRSPQKIADELVREATDAYRGEAKDDITVLVIKVR